MSSWAQIIVVYGRVQLYTKQSVNRRISQMRVGRFSSHTSYRADTLPSSRHSHPFRWTAAAQRRGRMLERLHHHHPATALAPHSQLGYPWLKPPPTVFRFLTKVFSIANETNSTVYSISLTSLFFLIYITINILKYCILLHSTHYVNRLEATYW